MQYEHVLSGLVRRRAELAGEANALRDQLARLQASIAHLDGAIVVFDPEAHPDRIKPVKQLRRSDRFARGEFTRALLAIMRADPKPVTVRDIAARMAAAHGLSVTTEGRRRTAHQVKQALDRLTEAGTVAMEGSEAEGWRWRVR